MEIILMVKYFKGVEFDGFNMTYNPNVHHRKSIRLKGYDYSQEGMYYITICIQNRENRLGEIKNGVMRTNDAGKMVDTWWGKLFENFSILLWMNMLLCQIIFMPL